MQKLTRADNPFETSNAALAFALHKAGVPFADNRHPCRNLYTKPIIFAAGGGKTDGHGNVIKPSRFVGREFGIDLVKEVFNDGRGAKGLVLYAFQRTKNLSRLLKAYSAQEKECEETNFVGREFEIAIMKKIAANEIDQSEGLLRIACVDQKLRAPFMSMWRKMVPQIQIENQGEPKKRETVRGTVFSHPGFKVASVNLSEEKRSHMKL